jgi:hypothetical protein
MHLMVDFKKFEDKIIILAVNFVTDRDKSYAV